ncbi:MAG: hypothetical protein ACREYE_02400, partial [Gammaproteobacteria bacterium]
WLVCGNNNLNTGQTHLAIQLRKLSENWQTPPYTNYRASGLVRRPRRDTRVVHGLFAGIEVPPSLSESSSHITRAHPSLSHVPLHVDSIYSKQPDPEPIAIQQLSRLHGSARTRKNGQIVIKSPAPEPMHCPKNPKQPKLRRTLVRLQLTHSPGQR